MKDLYLKTTKELGIKWLNSLEKDFSSYNNHTELLAIWTVLFMTITGLLILAFKSNILIMFLLFILALIIMFAGTFAAAYYLHALKYYNKKRLLPKIHNLLNKSFRLRTLLHFINPAPFFCKALNQFRKKTTLFAQQVARF